MTPSDENLRAVLLAEFAAMRAEISTFQALQGQFLNMSIVVLSACIAAAAALQGRAGEYASLAAIPFVVLALLYADASARIMRAARYVHLSLRPEILKLTGSLLTWEDYLRDDHPGSGLMAVLDKLRWLFFLGPSAYFTIFGFVFHQKWAWIDGLDVALIIIALMVLLHVFGRLHLKVVKP